MFKSKVTCCKPLTSKYLSWRVVRLRLNLFAFDLEILELGLP